MSDQQITCSDCGDVFAFSDAEQAFYAEKGLASPPKRCKACRQARKGARGAGAAGGRGGHEGARGGGRHFTGDVNEYRSPMTGGHLSPDWQQGAGRPRRGPGGSGQARPVRAGEGSAWGGNASEYRSPSPDYGRGEYRSPAFPQARGAGGPGRGADGRGRGGPPKPRDQAPREAAPKANARPKPKFDITCAECGAQAQVPFKPLEGRQVFCQECYRARRGNTRPAEGAPEVEAPDTGIVE